MITKEMKEKIVARLNSECNALRLRLESLASEVDKCIKSSTNYEDISLIVKHPLSMEGYDWCNSVDRSYALANSKYVCTTYRLSHLPYVESMLYPAEKGRDRAYPIGIRFSLATNDGEEIAISPSAECEFQTSNHDVFRKNFNIDGIEEFVESKADYTPNCIVDLLKKLTDDEIFNLIRDRTMQNFNAFMMWYADAVNYAREEDAKNTKILNDAFGLNEVVVKKVEPVQFKIVKVAKKTRK